MKITEAQAQYRCKAMELRKEQDELRKKKAMAERRYAYASKREDAEMAATLQLSLEENQKQLKQTQDVLAGLTEQYISIWNAEIARQQADQAKDMDEDMSKLMTIARRIANGDKVPPKDERKLLEYNEKLYMAAKNMAMMNLHKKHKKYRSLWEDEEKGQMEKTTDPKECADQAEVSQIPEIESGSTSTDTEAENDPQQEEAVEYFNQIEYTTKVCLNEQKAGQTRSALLYEVRKNE